MANTLANVGYAGYAVETTEGDLTVPNIFLPASSFNFDSTNEYITPDQLRGDRDRYIAMAAPYSVSGSMDMELVPEGIGPLLKSAFAHNGTVTPTVYAGGGYESIFTPGNAEDLTLSFESSAADILIMRYGGIRVNTLEISAAFGEIVTASFGLEGTTRGKQGSATAETYAEVLPFHFDGTSVQIDASPVANIKNFTFNVGNNLDRIGTLRKTRSWSRTTYGMRDLGLSATMDFQNTTDYDLFLAETEFPVTLHMEGAVIPSETSKYTLEIALPRVRWNMVNAPLSAGEFIEQAVEATILRPMNGDPIATITLVSDDSAAIL
jgi:hypothetical protein